MEAAELGDEILAGPQMEVVRVAEDDLRADRVELVRVDGLHRGLRPDGHEDRRADVAVRGVEHAGTRGAVAGGDLEDAHRPSLVFRPGSRCW